MSATKHVAYSLAFMAALRVVPRGVEAPEHYWTASCTKVVEVCNGIIQTTPQEAESYSDLMWPFRKIFGEGTRLANYVLAEPAAAIAINFEAWVRGDFKSGAALAAENVKAMEELNEQLDKELKRLEPIVKKIAELAKLTDDTADLLALENASTIIVEMIRSDEGFERDCQRMVTIHEKLEVVTGILAKVQKEYEEKLVVLDQLMQEYEQLGEKCSEELMAYKRGAESILEQLKQKPMGYESTICVE